MQSFRFFRLRNHLEQAKSFIFLQKLRNPVHLPSNWLRLWNLSQTIWNTLCVLATKTPNHLRPDGLTMSQQNRFPELPSEDSPTNTDCHARKLCNPSWRTGSWLGRTKRKGMTSWLRIWRHVKRNGPGGRSRVVWNMKARYTSLNKNSLLCSRNWTRLRKKLMSEREWLQEETLRLEFSFVLPRRREFKLRNVQWKANTTKGNFWLKVFIWVV